MWLMLQQDEPDDYVIATGEQHSVREFTERAFAEVGIHLRWEGEGLEEVGVVADVDMAQLASARGGSEPDSDDSLAAMIAPGRVLVRVDARYYRPTELYSVLGDASKALRVLGWEPTVTLEELTAEMVMEDIAGASGLDCGSAPAAPAHGIPPGAAPQRGNPVADRLDYERPVATDRGGDAEAQGA